MEYCSEGKGGGSEARITFIIKGRDRGETKPAAAAIKKREIRRNEVTMAENDLCTIFEQDGKVYCVISHEIPSRELAKLIGNEIRYMPKIPRAKMRVVIADEFRKMPFGKPSKT